MNKQGKVFGIGYPKTASSSLGNALSMLGYSTLHDPYEVMPALYPDELDQVGRAEQVLQASDALVGIIGLQYQALDKRFPGSRFVLTVRDDQKWLASLNTHLTRKPAAHSTDSLRTFVRAKLFKGHVDFEEQFADDFLAAYQAHNRGVLEYFSGRNDLLVMDVTRGDGWDSLCPFLQCDQPDQPFPWDNKKISSWKILKKRLKALGSRAG